MHHQSIPIDLPFCACGCGQRVTRPKNRFVKAHATGPSHPNFKGEWTVTKDGQTRVRVWIDDEMMARLGIAPGSRKRHALRSRVNWLLAHPGETLSQDEPIHHLNGDPTDDRPENLQKMPSNSDHVRLHAHAMNERRRQPDAACETCGGPIRPWRRFCSFACRGVAQRGAANVNYQGARQAGAKLTEAQVSEIRRRYWPRVVTAAMLADEYGVAVSTMEKILRRVQWAHVP